jgi:high-affinity iron transporter
MLSSFVIVLREGFEAFLIVAIVFAYLRKAGRTDLLPVARWGVAVALLASVGVGWLLKQGANTSLWEGILGLVAVPFVLGLVVHMWRAGPTLKGRMEERLARASERSTLWAALGVFTFTVLMITREGMETALMLLQVRSPEVAQGILLGLAGAGLMAWAWSRYGHRINVRRFFQVTGIFLILFVAQVAVYALHELSESGIVMSKSVLDFHMATEAYSPYGRYGRWFPLFMVAVPALWLAVAAVRDRVAHRTTE